MTKQQLHVALLEKKLIPHQKLEHILLSKGFLKDEALLDVLEKFTNIPKFPGVSHISLSFLKSQNKAFCEKNGCLLFKEDLETGIVSVAMMDPEDLFLKDAIEAEIGKKIKPYHITERLLKEVFEHIFSDFSPESSSNSANESLDETVDELFKNILTQAVRERASDIHFRPQESFLEVCYRIDGILDSRQQLHLSEWKRLLVRLKVLAHLDIAETRRPQHGRFLFDFAGRNIDLRVASHPTLYGENIVLRLLDKKSKVLSLDELGFCQEHLQKLRILKNKTQGMIIFTGPTGSGKTTSLYALLSEMDHVSKNIMTLEQPIEYLVSGIRQTEIGETLTYAQGIRSLLRQDPDIMLIGEIRDEETAQMALRASMTGHLVLSTLHTQDAYGVPGRLRDLGLPLDLLAGNLIGIISQRLVRKLCACQPQKDFACEVCKGTGYHGRLCISECILVTDTLRELMAKNATTLTLRHHIKENLFEDAKEKVEAGLTSYEEICRILGEQMET